MDWVIQNCSRYQATSFSSIHEAEDSSPASSDDRVGGNSQTPVTRRQGQQLIFDSDDSTGGAGDLNASQNDIGQDVIFTNSAETQNSSALTDAQRALG